MTENLWFPDNSTLCNFGAVGQIRLLERVLRDRGRWSSAVRYEVQQSIGHLPDLGVLVQENWLGEPLEIPSNQMLQVQRLQIAVFGGTPEAPLKHLGEAETLHLLTTRSEYAMSAWITDDRAAYEFGKSKGVITRSTRDLVELLISNGEFTADGGYGLLCDIEDAGRYVHRMPASMNELV